MRRRPTERANWQRQASPQKRPHHRFGALQLLELSKHQTQPGLHFLVRVENNSAVEPIDETSRHRQTQFAASRLLTFALMETHLNLMQFGFAHDAREAEQQPVMIGARVIEPFAVGDQNPEERAQLEQLMPIAIVARQS
jgi:hypothetical protein